MTSLRGRSRVGVELGPDRLALAGRRVDDDDRLRGVGVAREVGVRDRHRSGRRRRGVEAGDLGDDHRAGAEAVVAVELVGLDRHARAVPRHRQEVEVDPPAGVRGRVGDGEAVVGERIEADGRVQPVAAVRVLGRDRLSRRKAGDLGSRGPAPPVRRAAGAHRQVAPQRPRLPARPEALSAGAEDRSGDQATRAQALIRRRPKA